MLASLDAILTHLKKQEKKGGANQGQLFGSLPTGDIKYTRVPDWNEATKLWHERRVLGTFVTGHPVLLCRSRWEGVNQKTKLPRTTHTCSQHHEIGLASHGRVVVAGLIERIDIRGRVFFMDMTDHTGRIEVMGFGDDMERLAFCLRLNNVIAARLQVHYGDRGQSFRLKDAAPLWDYAAAVSSGAAVADK